MTADDPYRRILDAVDVAVQDIVVVPGRSSEDVSARLGQLWPDANIHVLEARTDGERADALARLPQPQLIVEASAAPKERREVLARKLIRFLPRGGVLAVLKPRTGKVVLQRQEEEQRYKVRDSEANELLDTRFGARWGRVVREIPPVSYRSAAVVAVHGTRDGWRGETAEPSTHGTIDVPALNVREYRDVTCWSHQRLALENYWLPDTFRHPLHRRLTHRALDDSGRTHAGLPAEAGRQPRQLEGSYFYFDSEYPGHFGHFLTEVVSRHWGWQEASRAAPGLRPLISLARGRDAIPDYQRRIYETLGVDVGAITYIPPNECVRVDSLFAATPAFAMPHYAAPELRDVWSTVANGLKRPDLETPRRLFVTRAVRHIRSCSNTDEVEELFSGLGFTVIYPENYDFAEQLTMFANAEVIAGFSGSGMFTTMFAPGKTVIVICADTYTATNEYLIASVLGGRLHYFLGDAETKHDPNGWTWKAYQSNFRFDVRQHADAVRAAVEEAGR